MSWYACVFCSMLMIAACAAQLKAEQSLPSDFGQERNFASPYDFLSLNEILNLRYGSSDGLSDQRKSTIRQRDRAHALVESNYPDSALHLLRPVLASCTLDDNNDRARAADLAHSMAFAFAAQGNYDSAHKALQRSISLRFKAGIQPNARDVLLLNNFGAAWREGHSFDSALSYHTRAWRLSRAIGGDTATLLAYSYIQTAKTMLLQGRYARGLGHIQYSLRSLLGWEADSLTGDVPVLASAAAQGLLTESLLLKAQLFVRVYLFESHDLRDLLSGLTNFRRGAEALDAYRASYGGPASRFWIRQLDRQHMPHALAAAVFAFQKTRHADYRSATFFFAEFRKRLASWDAYLALDLERRHFARDSLVEAVNRNNRQLLRLDATREFSSANPAFITERQALLEQLAELRKGWRKILPRLASMRWPAAPAGSEEVQRRLQPDEALLSYSYGPGRIYLLLLTAEDLHLIACRADSSIPDVVAAMYYEIRLGRANELTKNLKRLYDLLLAPALDRLGADITSLIIVPEGQLYSIPFEALHAGSRLKRKPGDFSQYRYPLLTRSFAYHFSATQFARRAARHEWRKLQAPPRELQFAGFAPDFGDTACSGSAAIAYPELHSNAHRIPAMSTLFTKDSGIRTLRSARRETEASFAAISDLDGDGVLAADCRANEAALRAAVATHNTLHLASHCFYHRLAPALSGLLLANPDGEDTANDGVMTSAESFRLDWSERWVALPYCDCRDNQLVSARALSAVLGGILSCENTCVAVSLWKASSKYTRFLWRDYYAGLMKGLSPEASLRAAKLARLQKDYSAHPVRWSGFLLYGW